MKFASFLLLAILFGTSLAVLSSQDFKDPVRIRQRIQEFIEKVKEEKANRMRDLQRDLYREQKRWTSLDANDY